MIRKISLHSSNAIYVWLYLIKQIVLLQYDPYSGIVAVFSQSIKSIEGANFEVHGI